jgi:glycosyltransferase involved in cell wall biosynthesis
VVNRRRQLVSPADVPAFDELEGIAVHHPRVLYVPKLDVASAFLYAVSAFGPLRRIRHTVDVVFTTWAYPDGVAAIALGKLLGIPTVLQVIGSDINVMAKRPGARAQLRGILGQATAVVAVSRALAQEVVSLGAREERVHVVRRGLDRERFQPRDREAARRRLQVPLNARVILYVGRLSKEKGVVDLLAAFQTLARKREDVRLVLVGAGPAEAECKRLREATGDRLQLTGEIDPAAVAEWVAACDVLTLPSYNEGTPNVLMEALSSGRRVVATPVGGIVDLVQSEVQGRLVSVGDSQALAQALADVADTPYSADEVASSVELYDWPEHAERIMNVLHQAVLA